MKRHLRKNYLRILIKTLLFAAIILLLILIFGFVKDYIQDLLDKLDFLIKYSEHQTAQINTLENEIHNLEASNARLSNIVTYQHEQLNELRVNGNTITVDLRPKEVNVPEDLHTEIDPQLHNDEFKLNTQTVLAGLLTTLTMIRGTVGALILP